MKTILFVNDSYFSYLLAKPIIDKFSENIQLIVMSTKIKGSKTKVINIFRKTYFKYFVFRSFIEFLAIINGLIGKKTVRSLAKRKKIRVILTNDVNELLMDLRGHDIAFAFNFDQILKEKVINLFPRGIINIHASKLPLDRGISPALWAFARGEKDIWTTIYEIDSGIDTGRIYNQYSMDVNDDESYFSLYKRICLEGGEALLKNYELIGCGKISTKSQDNLQKGIYHGWPDVFHKKEMRKNKKKFIKISDLLCMNKQK